MIAHTNNFKNAIKNFGREIDSIITYTIDDEEKVLTKDDLFSVTPVSNSNVLKSSMKQLEISSVNNIPLNTVINYKFGVKVNGSYEYLDFGNYIVYSSEKEEATNSYKILCYDKMLNSMKDYDATGITYPITIRNYINAICYKIGLVFHNINDTFPNYDKVLINDVYDGIGYTYRDILDELAQATASNICINSNDELELKYISSTPVDTIDEEFLKDIDVNFGELYGPINTIVLSRAGGADNIYYPEILPSDPHEFKIEDNQILNGNDRAEYMEAIYNQLNGLSYYVNDYSSTGICYLEIADKYNVTVKGKTYQCLMLNDEIQITQGLSERVYTDSPKEEVTEYKYQSSQDYAINNAYVTAKKAEAEVELLARSVIKVSDEATGVGSVTITNAYPGRLHRLEIKGNISLNFPQSQNGLYGYSNIISENNIISQNNTISSGVPYDNSILYPSSSLYPKDSYLVVGDSKYHLNFDYLNYMSSNVCDLYIYEDGKQWIERNVGIDEYGEMYQLESTIIEERGEIDINVESNSTLTLESFNNAVLNALYLLKNEYTDNFVTEVDAIARINLSPGNAQIQANKISLEGKTIDLTADNVNINSEHTKLDTNGKLTLNDDGTNQNAMLKVDSVDGFRDGNYALYTSRGFYIYQNHAGNDSVNTSINLSNVLQGVPQLSLSNDDTNIYSQLRNSRLIVRSVNDNKETVVSYDGIVTPTLTQTSREEMKKDFEKYSNAIKEVMATDIYKYHLKDELDSDKKHVGFVIGNNYKHSDDIVSKNNDGVDLYSMVSVLWQAVKEQQEEIKKLKEIIKGG